MNEGRSTVAAVVLAIGLAGAGWLIGNGFRAGRADTRYTTVKGLAERAVKANLALWPIRFVATNNDLAAAEGRVTSDTQTVNDFITRHGISAESIHLSRLSVNDLYAQAYQSGTVQSRYIIEKTLLVRTDAVDAVAQAAQDIGELVKAGVVLGAGGEGPTYAYTRLNDIKPEMIAEATKNAREAASRFAADSGATLGDIRRAQQGIFEILARDEAPSLDEPSQLDKRVRIVSTIEYFLEP